MLGISLSLMSFCVEAVGAAISTSNWLLAGGIWNDAKVWDDSASWED